VLHQCRFLETVYIISLFICIIVKIDADIEVFNTRVRRLLLSYVITIHVRYRRSETDMQTYGRHARSIYSA